MMQSKLNRSWLNVASENISTKICSSFLKYKPFKLSVYRLQKFTKNIFQGKIINPGWCVGVIIIIIIEEEGGGGGIFYKLLMALNLR